MHQPRILAVDQGTTNTKALLLDGTGRTVSRASRPVQVEFPRPGWVEQDASALWRSVGEAIDECLASAGDDRPVAAIALTNQRESAIAWDRETGRPLGPCIVWQCRRTAPFCADLRQRGALPTIQRTTGLTIDPLFSASKFRWLLDQIDNGRARAESGTICLGTVDSWLVWNLTGGHAHVTDTTNASRTQLMALGTTSWDDEMLEIFGVPRRALPTIAPSSGVVDHTVRRGRLAAGVPIASLIGDSHAALFGHAAFRPGSVKATYGTGSSLMTLVDTPVASRSGLSTTVAWSFPSGAWFALEGNITVTGSAVDWVAQLIGRSSPEDAASLAATVDGSDGVYLVPALAGLGAPYWDDAARGVLCGLTRGTTAAHVARAAIESIAFQVRDVFDAMAVDVGAPPPALFADGGASRNDALMQFQADILGCPVVRSQSTDLSACGAAWLAGLAVGIWQQLDDLAALPRPIDRFEPVMSGEERSRRHAGWLDAVSRCRTHVPGGMTSVPAAL